MKASAPAIRVTAEFGPGTESVGSSNATAPQLGALAGWNFQNQNLVFGPEVGLTWMGGKAQKGGSMPNNYSYASYGGSTHSYAGSTTRTSRIKAVLDIAGRIGWDFNGTLPYFKAGFALADVNSSWSINTYSVTGANNDFSTSKNSWQPGFVIGGGVEQQIGPGWSVKGEISWMDFATRS